MASIKLIYFDVRARGEVSRLILSQSKKKWEDERIAFENWPELKPKTPLGTLPVLEVNGKQFGQNIAISTYLSKECGLHGKTAVDALTIDQMQLTREDLLVEEAKAHFEKDDAKKAELAKGLTETQYPKFLKFCENQLKANGGTGYVVGKNLSTADLVIFAGTENMVKAYPDILKDYPLITACLKKVESADGIKQYLAKRKETPM